MLWTVLQRGPHGLCLILSVNSHIKWVWKWIQDDCSLSWQLDCSILRDPDPKPSNKASPKIQTLKNSEIINIYYFNLLNCGVIYSAAIDNWYTGSYLQLNWGGKNQGQASLTLGKVGFLEGCRQIPSAFTNMFISSDNFPSPCWHEYQGQGSLTMEFLSTMESEGSQAHHSYHVIKTSLPDFTFSKAPD